MSSVFVIISETMPVNGTYPASGVEKIYATEQDAWEYLAGLSFGLGTEDGEPLDPFDTAFYATVDPEKYEYTEYRIEEHTIQQGE